MEEFSFPTVDAGWDSFQLSFPHFTSSEKSTKQNHPTSNDEEKMDMLWEIFNEEITWISYDKTGVEEQSEEVVSVENNDGTADDSKLHMEEDGMIIGVLGGQGKGLTRGGSMRTKVIGSYQILKLLKKLLSSVQKLPS